MKVRVVLINYQTPEMTLKALECVLPDLGRIPAGGRVVVVDNDSRDGSYDRIVAEVKERGWETLVDVIATAKNGGFAYGVNCGARPGLDSSDPPEYVYLLNSDAFVEPGALACLVDYLDSHPEAGIAGSRIFGPDGGTHNTAFRFHSLAGEFESAVGIGLVTRLLYRWKVSKPVPDQTERVDWLAGASMLIRSQVFRDVGFFDENFFLYYEETDFCRRAAAAGWTTWYIPASRVMHIGGASTGWKDTTRPRAPYWFQSRRHYFVKHHGRFGTLMIDLACVIGMMIGRTKFALLGRQYPRPPRFLRDFVRFNFVSPPAHPCPPDSMER